MAWSHVLGHNRQVDAFRHVVAKHRLAHGYLFVGPAGIGKRRFARELVKALLCEAPGRSLADLTACDRCDACLLVDASTHPDFFQVGRPEEKNEFPIELMQELCRGFSLKPAREHGKVAVLDDADDLNEEAANCFLKTLEEPPPGSVFILLGTSLDRQMATIRSRCQVVRFAPLPEAQVREVLRRGGIQDADQLDRLTRLAAGSPGQALELADDALWQFRRSLLQGLAQPRVDVVALSRGFIEFAEDAGKEGAAQRRRAALVLRLLIEAFSDALHHHAGREPRSTGPDELLLLRALMERAGPDRILALLDRCLETEVQLGRYVQLALVLEGLLDALAQVLDDRAVPPLRLPG